MKLFSRTLLAVFLFLSLFSYEVFASQNINNSLDGGMRDIYSFKMKEAEVYFNNFIKSNPSDPRGYYFLASIYLWKYLGNSKGGDLEKFVGYADISISKSDRLIAEENTLADALYFRGSMYGYKSIAYGKAEKYLEMIWASKNCTSDLNDVLKLNPNYYDAYLGLGLFKFALGQVPSSFRWALNMIGFEGDMNQGLDMIRKAATKGKMAKVEAQYYLAQILTDYYQSYNESSALLRDLSNKFPGNLLFQYSLAVTNIKKRELKPAEKSLNKILLNKDQSFNQLESFSHFLLGDINFFRNEHSSAIRNYEKFLSTTSSREYTGIASLRIAYSYELMGDNSAAKTYYEKIRKANWSNEEDLFAKRKAAEHLQNRPSDDDRFIIRYQNALETGNYQLVIDSVKARYPQLSQNCSKGIAGIVLSDALYNIGNYNESLNYALLAVQSNCESEKYIRPFGNYFAAKAMFQMGEKMKAYSLLEKAEDAKDYDFYSKLKPLLLQFRNKF